MAANGESKSVNDGIANSHQDELVLRGVQPRHQVAYRIFKVCRAFGIGLIILAALMFGLTFIEAFKRFTGLGFYRMAILYVLIGAGIFLLIMLLDRLLFLRKAPFDDWVFDIASKRLGTEVIFYDSKYIYIQFDRTGKEVDKREFVTEMSDKSIHYSYFYVKTFIDRGVIQVECTKRQPIPTLAKFSEKDDLFWNIIPMGLTIHPVNQTIAPIGWYLNDKNINDQMLQTVPSTSVLICGGTGCYSKNTPIPVYDTLIKE